MALGSASDDRIFAPATAHDVCTELEAPAHRDARFLLGEWRRAADAGGFIVGIHVPSRALARVLPGLSLYEPLDEARDFRVRLAGTALRLRFGRDITGAKLSQLFTGRDFVQYGGRMRRVLTKGEPFVLDLKIMHDGLMRLHYEWLGLQVFSSDCRDAWVMTGHFLHRS